MKQKYQVYLYKSFQRGRCDACFRPTKHYMYSAYRAVNPDTCCKKCYKSIFVDPISYQGCAAPKYKNIVDMYHEKFTRRWRRRKRTLAQSPKVIIRKAVAMLEGEWE